LERPPPVPLPATPPGSQDRHRRLHSRNRGSRGRETPSAGHLPPPQFRADYFGAAFLDRGFAADRRSAASFARRSSRRRAVLATIWSWRRFSSATLCAPSRARSSSRKRRRALPLSSARFLSPSLISAARNPPSPRRELPRARPQTAESRPVDVRDGTASGAVPTGRRGSPAGDCKPNSEILAKFHRAEGKSRDWPRLNSTRRAAFLSAANATDATKRDCRDGVRRHRQQPTRPPRRSWPRPRP